MRWDTLWELTCGLCAGSFSVLKSCKGGVALVSAAVVCVFWWLVLGARRRIVEKVVARLGGLEWTRSDFCRGWLITGDTGSGKTRSGITPLLFQVFQNEPRWGGVCIDDKGVYWETLSEMAAHFQRSSDLLLVQVRPEGAPSDWVPPQRFNLIGDRSIPPSTHAKFVVDTASSLGQRGEKSFFRSQAQTHIGKAIELLVEIGGEVTLSKVYGVLLNDGELVSALRELSALYPSERRQALVDHFGNRFIGQPAEQMGGVKETIANYLQPFLAPEIAEVFCTPESTFELAAVDRGRILCTAMPQKFQMERRYINTFLKMLFYTHVLRRFDKGRVERAGDNLLILWADEAQCFMTASEDGMSDYNSVDIILEAGATVVAAVQSSTSFIPPLGRDKARVLTLNLRNRMIFRAADEEGALEAADFLGRSRVVKRSWGFANGRRSTHYNEVEEHKVKTHVLRSLPRHTCILVHAERGLRRRVIAPIDPDGRVCGWFRRPWI